MTVRIREGAVQQDQVKHIVVDIEIIHKLQFHSIKMQAGHDQFDHNSPFLHCATSLAAPRNNFCNS